MKNKYKYVISAIKSNDLKKTQSSLNELDDILPIEENALIFAFKNEHIDMINLLEKNGFNIPFYKDSLLYETINHKNTQCIEKLVSLGVNLHLNNQNLFMTFITQNNLTLTQYLVHHGADIYIGNHTPLKTAINSKEIDCLDYLYHLYDNKVVAQEVIKKELARMDNLNAIFNNPVFSQLYEDEYGNIKRWFSVILLNDRLEKLLTKETTDIKKNKI